MDRPTFLFHLGYHFNLLLHPNGVAMESKPPRTPQFRDFWNNKVCPNLEKYFNYNDIARVINEIESEWNYEQNSFQQPHQQHIIQQQQQAPQQQIIQQQQQAPQQQIIERQLDQRMVPYRANPRSLPEHTRRYTIHQNALEQLRLENDLKNAQLEKDKKLLEELKEEKKEKTRLDNQLALVRTRIGNIQTPNNNNN